MPPAEWYSDSRAIHASGDATSEKSNGVALVIQTTALPQQRPPLPVDELSEA